MEQKEIYSLLIPLHTERLLVPRVCVAEVIGYTEPERLGGNGALPNWFLGLVEWNGRRLPVVSFESLSGEGALDEQRGRARGDDGSQEPGVRPQVADPTPQVPEPASEEEVTQAPAWLAALRPVDEQRI